MIVIIDYGMGNLGSTLNMLKKIGVKALVSANPKEILLASKIILPGVGAFDEGMKNLRQRELIPVLEKKALEEKVPVLGICLGMQLFSKESAEGHQKGLGWIDATTTQFSFTPEIAAKLKIPHMGWNTILPNQSNDPLLKDSASEMRFYFVHSYHLKCNQPENIVAMTHHGYDFPSIIRSGKIYGTQFHPEKSHRFGMQLFRNFVGL